MRFNPNVVRLGRRAPQHDARTLKLARYLDAMDLPAAPAAIDYGSKVIEWGMLGNDTVGDCTIAGLLHMIMLWESQQGPAPTFTTAQAVALYSKLCGYVPGKPSTDQGGVELDILKAWRASPIEGCAISAYVSVDPTNWAHIMIAHWLFGSLYLGVNLPLSAQNEKIWRSIEDAPGSWGGHCVVTTAYRDRKSCLKPALLTVSTWGTTQKATPAWIAKYCDEIWAPISPRWLGADDKAPNGFDMAQLIADQALIAA